MAAVYPKRLLLRHRQDFPKALSKKKLSSTSASFASAQEQPLPALKRTALHIAHRSTNHGAGAGVPCVTIRQTVQKNVV